mgnify:CR=1 FL=1
MNSAATHWLASARIRRASVGANARRCCCRWQFSHSTVLRAKFRYQIYSDARSAAWGESPLMGFEAPTAALAGKKLTLAWVAASAAGSGPPGRERGAEGQGGGLGGGGGR